MKSQFTESLNWVTVAPYPYIIQTPPTAWSGVVAGPMTGTNTIYSDIIPVVWYDDLGLEVTWTGTPTGTIQIMGSASGVNFYALTFNPILAQPGGAAGGYLIDLQQFPWRYLMVQYTNTSGSGLLYTTITAKEI